MPLIKHLAYELEINFYKYTENNSEQLISIIIPARNEEGNKELLIKALNKFKQISNNFEIIFVEGNSMDNTYSMLEDLKANFSDSFKIYLLKQSGKGKKNAVVEGCNISSGETLAIVDSDFTVDIDGVKGDQERTQVAIWESDGTTEVESDRYSTNNEDVTVESVSLTAGNTYYLSVDVQALSRVGTFTLCYDTVPVSYTHLTLPTNREV